MREIDASVLTNAMADDADDGNRARDALRESESLAAPYLIHVETTSVLRKRCMARTLTATRFKAALGDLEDLSLDVYPTFPLMVRAYELRSNVSPYDAAYVALAELLDCPMLTADRRLAKAPGVRCDVIVLTR